MKALKRIWSILSGAESRKHLVNIDDHLERILIYLKNKGI
jgi:hypothetical protein